MKAFFSKRHKEALTSKKLKPYISYPCRVAIKRLLEQHSDFGETDYGYGNFTFMLVENELKTFWGVNNLLAFDSNN